jgi:uncharacterized protein
MPQGENMSIPPLLISILIVLTVSAALIVSGLKKQPGLGIIAAVVIIILTLWLRGEPITAIGFGLPNHWAATILLALALGIIIQLLSVAVIEPLADRIMKSKHNHAIIANVKGSWKVFLQWMLIVWVLVAFLEEGIYRGFLMTEIANIAGTSRPALVFNVIISSAVFGLSHGYQGRSGILSTGLIGAILGTLFVLSGFNLWLVILTHGFIDTIGIALIALDREDFIREKIGLRFQ